MNYQNRPVNGDGRPFHFETASELRSRDDEELAGKVRDGCDDALAILHERHSRAVFGTARRVVGDVGEAEDTVQQVFFELHQAAGTIGDSEGSVKAWLHRRVFQRALNKREHLNSIGFYKSEDAEQLEAECERGMAARFEMLPSELSYLVNELLEQVSSLQRAVIKLYLYEGLAMKEIAPRLGQTLDVVRHNFYNGLKKMRLLLERRERQGEGVDVDNE